MVGYLIITVVVDDIQPPINQTKKNTVWKSGRQKKTFELHKNIRMQKMKTFFLFVS